MSAELTAALHQSETDVMAAIENVQRLVTQAAKEVARLSDLETRLQESIAPLQAQITALNAEKEGVQKDVYAAHADARTARETEAAASQEFRAKLTAETDAYKVECQRQVRAATERRDEALKAALAAEREQAAKVKQLEDFKASLVGG